MSDWGDYPHLALEYQGDATKVVVGTHKKLDWKCNTCEHEWQAVGYSRVTGNGCPACSNRVIHSDGRNSMAMTHPDLAAEYQGDATKVIAGTSKKLDWKCNTCKHEWKVKGEYRVQGAGCSACVNQCIHSDGRNSMANTHPELAKEYQGDANLIIAGTNKKLDWKCNTCEHEWESSGSNRAGRKSGCPPCREVERNNAFIKTNLEKKGSMAETHPKLAAEYQGDATKIVAGVNRKLLWKCSTCDNEWQASGSNRYSGCGCPACFGFLHSDGRNSMAVTHPELASEYQGDATKIIATTETKLPWKCGTCDNEWQAQGYNRVYGTGCPSCAESGFKPNEPAYCYLLKYVFTDETIRYKQGISNNVKIRVSKLRFEVNKVFPETKVALIDQMYFEVGQDALDLENHFKSISEIRWTPEQNFDGSTEMYAEGILEAWAEKNVKYTEIVLEDEKHGLHFAKS